MRPWLTVTAAVILGFAVAPRAQSADSALPCGTASIVTPIDEAPRGVRVHDEPSLDSPWKIAVPRGHRVRCLDIVTARGTTFYKVLAPDGTRDGKVGWASTDVMRLVPPHEIGFKVHLLDVGSGDAAIITLGTTDIVIDGGPNPQYVAEYLRKSRATSGPIELVVVSHPEPDHYRGLRVLRGRILHYWDGGRDWDASAEYGRFVRGMAGAGLRRRREVTNAVAQEITIPEVPEVDFAVLRAPRSAATADEPSHEGSLILLMRVGGKRLLFPGDIVGKKTSDRAKAVAQKMEKLAIEQFAKEEPKKKKNQANRQRKWYEARAAVDVLKVPHHGSEHANTQQFIQAFSPRFAVIAASPKEFMPAKNVVQRYEEAHATVLRTDRTPRHGNDDILCIREPRSAAVKCNYLDVLND